MGSIKTKSEELYYEIFTLFKGREIYSECWKIILWPNELTWTDPADYHVISSKLRYIGTNDAISSDLRFTMTVDALSSELRWIGTSDAISSRIRFTRNEQMLYYPEFWCYFIQTEICRAFDRINIDQNYWCYIIRTKMYQNYWCCIIRTKIFLDYWRCVILI